MPEVSFGPAVSTSSGATLTLLYDRIDYDATNGWLVNPRVRFYSKSGWSDSVNSMSSGGSAINGGQFHSGTINGGTREWAVSAKGVPLTYGSETNYTFAVTVTNLSFYSGDSSSVTRTWTIAFPARPYQKPNPASSFTNTLVTDNRADLSWVANYTGGNGATPWNNQYIDRTETGDWSGAVQVAALGWEPTSWSDTSLQPNRRYNYRHRATNPAGSSPYAYAPNSLYTKPAAPTQVAATKQADGSIKVTATNAAPWADAFEFSDSPDGTSWTVLTSSAASTEYVHNAPTPSVTHRYRVRAKTPDGKWSDYSTTSNVVQLQAPPNPPSWKPAEAAYDTTSPITTAWTHSPVDTTPQTAYEAQRRTSTDNGATWSAWTTTGKTTSTTQARTWAASTFPQGVLVEMQVRTWGAHATASSWSSTLLFRTSARPVAGITSPAANAVVTGKTVTLGWNYADAEDTAQSAFEVTLWKGTERVGGAWQTSGAAKTYSIPTALEDDSSYRADLRVRDGHGLWSDITNVTFSVNFLPPPAPTVDASWDQQTGALSLTIGNPDPSGGAPAAVSNDVYRDGVLIATNVNLNTTFIDRIAPVNGGTYWVDAVSALPSEGRTVVEVDPDPEVRRRFWLNAGIGWTKVASFWANVKRGQTRGRKRSLDYFSGRELEVETIGEGRVSKLRVTGTILLTEDSPNDFWDVAEAETGACYRDRFGTWFVSVEPIDADADVDIAAQISVSMTETDYVDPVWGA